MKIKRRLRLILIIFITLFIIVKSNAVNAAGYNISATSNDVKVGENVTINISFTAAAWHIEVSGDGIVGKSYASQTDDLSEKTTAERFSLNTSKAGTYTITISGDITDVNGDTTEISKAITVKVSEKSDTTQSNKNNNTEKNDNQKTTETKKSNIATLSNLGIKPNDFKGFSPNKYSYDVEVPNETETIEVYAYKGQDKQTIAGTGSKKLNVGQNKFEVQVTAEDRTTKKTYTINVTRKDKTEENPEETEEIPSDDENIENTFGLSELSIEGFELNPQFQTDVYDYNVEISDSIEKLNITTVATEANANIEITGNENFKEGENVVTILVKSQDEKNTIAYQIIANKKVPELIAETEEKVNENENIIIISVIVAAIILIILIIIIIIKSRKSSKNIESTYIPYGSLINKNDNEEIDEEDDNNDEIENYENMTPENYEEPKIKTKGTFSKELYEKADENENIENGYSGRTEKKKHSKGKRFK